MFRKRKRQGNENVILAKNVSVNVAISKTSVWVDVDGYCVLLIRDINDLRVQDSRNDGKQPLAVRGESTDPNERAIAAD